MAQPYHLGIPTQDHSCIELGSGPVSSIKHKMRLGNSHVEYVGNNNKNLFLSHRSCICVRLTDGAARILTVIPLFYLSHNKSPVSMVTLSHWERKSAYNGASKRRGALKIFGRVQVPNPGCERQVLYPLCNAPRACGQH